MTRTNGNMTKAEKIDLLAMYLATSNLGMDSKERPKEARQIREAWDRCRDALYEATGDEGAGIDEMRDWQKDLKAGAVYAWSVGLQELPWLIQPDDLSLPLLEKIHKDIARREKEEKARKKQEEAREKRKQDPLDLDTVREEIDCFFTFVEREGENAIRFDSGDTSIWIYNDGEIDGDRKGMRKALGNDLAMVNQSLTHAGFHAI